MHIDVKGKVEEIDVTWRYYHVVQEDGQRLTLVVTFDTEVAPRLDRRLVDAVDLIRSTGAVRARNASNTKSEK
jgi:hypothetical protein